MKTRRRARVAGSQTPWERLSGDGFSATPHGFVLMVDVEGRLVTATLSWHVRFFRWWKWNDGTRWRDTVPRPGAERGWSEWQEVLNRALDSETPFQTTVILHGKRARHVRVECLGQPLRDGAGRSLGAIVAGRFYPRVDGGSDGGTSKADGGLASAGTPETASLWVRPKRRRGEEGYFIESVSGGADRLLGGAPAVRAGASFPDCLPEAVRGELASLVACAADTGEPAMQRPAPPGAGGWSRTSSLELTVLPAPGSRFCLVLRRDPLRDAGRRMLVACAEQLVSVEGELRRAQRLATQGMLAAAIGHEVNNCLGVALANASLFQEQNRSNPNTVRAIQPVIHAVQTAGKICQRFRHLSGHAEPAPEVVNLAEAVQRSFDMLVRIVPRRISFAPESGVPLFVRADSTHLEQIVVNLVLNARDATREAVGKITLHVGRSETPAAGGAGCWLEVLDDGAGIPAEVRRKLFTAFFTTKLGKRGTGLGLATVLRLTKAMGGEVKLTSQVGRGTSVRIVLPAVEPAAD